MKILLTGSTGLIGSRFEALMYEAHDIIPLVSSQGIDITDKDSVAGFLKDKDFDVVIHLAGKTDVDGCEMDKEEDLKTLNYREEEILDFDARDVNTVDWKGKKTAIAINTIGTKNLYDIAREYNKKFVYISSDFIFSGNEEFSSEETKPSPVNWYGTSKYLGEKIIDTSGDLIVRLSFPYGYANPVKKDLVWKLLDVLSLRDQVSLVADQIITPTFIDDIVHGLIFLLEKKSAGTFHLTGSSSLSPLQIGQKIKETFSLTTEIAESKLADVYAGKAPRPFHSIMKNDKLLHLGYQTKTFEEGLALLNSA